MFNNIIPKSPVSNQDFVWLAEYVDATHLAEYDFKTHNENSFYSIKRDSLIRFGLLGLGNQLYFECIGGTFKVMGRTFDFIYNHNGENYNLTGLNSFYNDIITYKHAESIIMIGDGKSGGGTVDQIVQYNFGYKTKIQFGNDTQFNFQVVCEVPLNEPMRFSIKLVTNKDLDGKFMVLRNYSICDEFEAKLTKDVGGELNWVLK